MCSHLILPWGQPYIGATGPTINIISSYNQHHLILLWNQLVITLNQLLLPLNLLILQLNQCNLPLNQLNPRLPTLHALQMLWFVPGKKLWRVGFTHLALNATVVDVAAPSVDELAGPQDGAYTQL